MDDKIKTRGINLSYRFNQYDEIKVWCLKNLSDDWEIDWWANNIYFESEDDAIMFKLKFGI